jgi:hypothetical protein
MNRRTFLTTLTKAAIGAPVALHQLDGLEAIVQPHGTVRHHHGDTRPYQIYAVTINDGPRVNDATNNIIAALHKHLGVDILTVPGHERNDPWLDRAHFITPGTNAYSDAIQRNPQISVYGNDPGDVTINPADHYQTIDDIPADNDLWSRIATTAAIIRDEITHAASPAATMLHHEPYRQALDNALRTDLAHADIGLAYIEPNP